MPVTVYPERGGIGAAAQARLYASWAALPPDAPVGSLASIPRLCGHGTFLAVKESTRWAVLPGQAVISDAGAGASTAGYDLTATGTSSVVMASYTIPAGMIGDGEEWFASAQLRNNGVYVSGNDAASVRFADGPITFAGQATAAGANRIARTETRVARFGSMISRQNSVNSASYSNVGNGDLTLDLSLPRVVEGVLTPGAAANTLRLRHWAVGRYA